MSGKVWINTSTKGQAVVDAYSGATPLGDAAAGFADKIEHDESIYRIIPGSVGETSTIASLDWRWYFIIYRVAVGIWPQFYKVDFFGSDL
jgi:hypothetical protein